jgi:hypothetical protein
MAKAKVKTRRRRRERSTREMVRWYARRLMNEPSVPSAMLVTMIETAEAIKTDCTAQLAELELVENSKRDGAAVQHLNQSIQRAEQELRAWRETAEKESQHPKRAMLAAIRCQACNEKFLADRLFDVARKVDVALAAAGIKEEITNPDDVLAEAFDDPKKWMRCPECASSNICWIQNQDDIEAGSVETVIDVAGEIIDELKSKLPDFADSAEARRECMRLLFAICVSLSRGAELEREHEKRQDRLRELVREFGLEEGCKRWFPKAWERPAPSLNEPARS